MDRETLGNLGAAAFLAGAAIGVGTVAYALRMGAPEVGSVAGWIYLGVLILALGLTYGGAIAARYSQSGELARVVLETAIGFGIVMAVILWRVLQR